MLKHFAIERLLYRLQRSPYADQFVLKGAMLFTVWEGPSARQTQDVDLLGFGEPDSMVQIFREVAATTVDPDDAVRFDPASVRAEPIRDETEYRGVRVRVTGALERARIPTQIDIGFGDAVTPAPVETQYPALLDLPAPRIRMYPRETVVAEKFQALVALGATNTRVKDFYDLWHMAASYEFDGIQLREAVAATFARRDTDLPASTPVGLTDDYLNDPDHARQWNGIARRLGGASVPPFRAAGRLISQFILPVTRGATLGAWRAGGPWNGVRA